MEPLACLKSHKVLVERLNNLKGQLFDQYVEEIESKEFMDENNEFIENLKQEAKPFWDHIQSEVTPTNLKQMAETLKLYEIHLIF